MPIDDPGDKLISVVKYDPLTDVKPRRLCTPEERDRQMAVERRYRERNKELLRERSRIYRENNREALRARDRARYNADPETYKARARMRQAKDPAGTRRAQWKYLYGLTPDQFEELFEKQGRACAICRTIDFGKRAPHIDHCHGTDEIRGILCDPCNRGIGIFKDDPTRLESAAAYLRKAKL